MTTRFRPQSDPAPHRFFTISGIAIALLIASALIILAMIVTIALTQAQSEAQLEEQIVSLQQSTDELQETVDELLAAVENVEGVGGGQLEQIDATLDQVDEHLELVENDLEALAVEVIPDAQADSETTTPAAEEGVFMTAAWALSVLSIATALGAGVVFWRLARRRRLL